MASWAEFESSAPDMASAGHALLHARGDGEALLATVRSELPPRVHPINVGIVDGTLYAFILPSTKLSDLASDGRYALHAHVDPSAPSEFLLRGHAREETDPEARRRAAESWSFGVDDSNRLFAFDIESATLGVRDDPDDWPPRYTRWTDA